jgi:hypothetical protein
MLPLHECVAMPLQDVVESVADPVVESAAEPLHAVANPTAAGAAPTKTYCLCVWV